MRSFLRYYSNTKRGCWVAKESVEQHSKRECLKSAISKGKGFLLGGKQKWTVTKLFIKRKKQLDLSEKGENTGKASGKHVINLHSTGISQVIKIKDLKQL